MRWLLVLRAMGLAVFGLGLGAAPMVAWANFS